MRGISGQLTPKLKEAYGDADIRKQEAFPVKTFRELMQYVAQLSYANKDHLLFFRGQSKDHLNKTGASSFYPSIYRGERLAKAELEARFEILASASKRLVDAFSREKIEGSADVRKRRYIQWSILQHYEVCSTPLLDFTQSLRVACSFASLDQDADYSYIFVFGLPYLTNRISINSEHDLINVRLLSICPPDALRPYFQEGYLAGTDESTTEFHSKDEFDFNARLIAKFRFKNLKSFWGSNFDPIPKRALYPNGDRIKKLCDSISGEIGTDVDPGKLGALLQAWTTLESQLLDIARSRKERIFSAYEALRIIQHAELIDSSILERLDKVRRVRNTAVHHPDRVKSSELLSAREEIEHLSTLVGTIRSKIPKNAVP